MLENGNPVTIVDSMRQVTIFKSRIFIFFYVLFWFRYQKRFFYVSNTAQRMQLCILAHVTNEATWRNLRVCLHCAVHLRLRPHAKSVISVTYGTRNPNRNPEDMKASFLLLSSQCSHLRQSNGLWIFGWCKIDQHCVFLLIYSVYVIVTSRLSLKLI